MEAARRILAGVAKRLTQFSEQAQFEAYFASDALLKKLRASIEELRKLGNAVAADDLAGQLKNLYDQGQRALRDRNELVTGNTIRLGRHAFTVNQQALDLNIVSHQGRMAYHLTGTDYFLALDEPRLEALQAYWEQENLAESRQVYRAEYLAYQVVLAARANRDEWSWAALLEAVRNPDTAQLDEAVRRFAAPRYQENYQKGIHDSDAANILRSLVPMLEDAGLLRFSPLARALAVLYWQHLSTGTDQQQAAQTLAHQAGQAEMMQLQFGSSGLLQQIMPPTRQALQAFMQEQQLAFDALLDPENESIAGLLNESAAYLLAELGAAATSRAATHEWVVSRAAADLAAAMQNHFSQQTLALPWMDESLNLAGRWQMASEWLHGFIEHENAAQHAQLTSLLPEAAAALLVALPRRIQSGTLQTTVHGLLGEHGRISEQSLVLQLNDFMRRLQHHTQVIVPAFQQLQQLRQTLVAEEKARLRLEQFQAKPLSSFVRNRLIDEVYLPMVGENLAKQIGAAGEQRRTDSMGMLLLISPPGYGKTTLMEYLCDRLGHDLRAHQLPGARACCDFARSGAGRQQCGPHGA